jgi:hypothetical protein
VALVLVACVILQFVRVRDVKEGDRAAPARPVSLNQRVPEKLAGWDGHDEPLGPNEFLRSVLERTLNYDDVVYRVYTRRGVSVGVYVAYWSQGRMPVSKVASHTPDRCWPENGWTCEERRFPVVLSAGNVTLLPAPWRRFLPPGGGSPEYVTYWLLVGGKLFDFGESFNGTPSLIAWWRDSVKYAVLGSREQLFIRLSSNRPFAELCDDPGFQQIVRALAKLGVDADSHGAG